MSSFFPFFFQLSRLLKELKETKEAQSPEVKLLCSLEAKLLTMELRQQDREKELNKVDWVETWNEAHHHGPNWCWNVAFVIRWGELLFSKSYLMDRLTRKIKYSFSALRLVKSRQNAVSKFFLQIIGGSWPEGDQQSQVNHWRCLAVDKVRELEAFRLELDSILDIVRHMQRQGMNVATPDSWAPTEVIQELDNTLFQFQEFLFYCVV